MTIFGYTIVKASRIAEMETKIVQLNNCANTNSSRAVKLKKDYETLKCERNKTVKELTAKVKELNKIIEFYERGDIDNRVL